LYRSCALSVGVARAERITTAEVASIEAAA
jgi:hypothetical protein